MSLTTRRRRTDATAAGAVAVVLTTLLAACSAVETVREGRNACTELEVTIVGTEDDDQLRGTPDQDVIDGRGGNDVVRGLGGDDVLCGGAGGDRLLGGGGDDVLDGGTDERYAEDADFYEWGGDSLDGGAGDDELVAGPHDGHDPVDELVYAHAAGPVVVDLADAAATGGAGTDRIVGEVASVLGSAHDDRLLGSDRPERLMGGPGGDVVDGRGGGDQLEAVGQADQLHGPTRLSPDAAADVNALRGGAGNDELRGGPGQDTVSGGLGNDSLSGDAGPDRLFGGAGNDQVSDAAAAPAPGAGTGEGTTQVLDGGPGRDGVNEVYLARPRPVGDDTLYDDATGTLDLAAGTLTATATAGGQVPVVFRVPVRGFEDAVTSPGRWTVYGTAGPNEVIAFDEKRPVVIHGRDGDDHLAGSFRDDLLDGGAGQDSALGYTGRDRYVGVEKRLD